MGWETARATYPKYNTQLLIENLRLIDTSFVFANIFFLINDMTYN